MTLILTCLTKDCVYQVSDRRLTSFDPPRAPIDDESNKALLIGGRVVVGYTGISKINGENTDLWLTRTAASANSHDLAKVCRRIQDEATVAFKRMQFASRFKRHGFQVAGWFSKPDSAGLYPGVVTIDNAIDPARNWLPYARPTFDLTLHFPKLGAAQFDISSVGIKLASSEEAAIYQLMRKCVHRRIRQQEAVLTAMIMSMRWLHRRYEPNSPIGPNLMAVSIPRVAAEKAVQTGGFLARAGGPLTTMATFLDVHSSGRTQVFGPHVVHGGASMTGFVAGPIRPGAPK